MRIGKSKYNNCKITLKISLEGDQSCPHGLAVGVLWFEKNQAVVRQSWSVQVVVFRRSASAVVGGVAPLEGFRPAGLVEDLLAGLTGLVARGTRIVGLRVEAAARTAAEAAMAAGVEDQAAEAVTFWRLAGGWGLRSKSSSRSRFTAFHRVTAERSGKLGMLF